MSSRAKALVVSLASAGAIAAGLGSAAVGSAKAVRHVSCTATEVPYTHSGSQQLGLARCGSPLGDGVLQLSSAGKVAGNVITLSGGLKYYLNTGTIHGSYRLAGSTTTGRLAGTARITGGTGAYRGAAGVGRVVCHAPVNSSRATCTMKLSLTRL